MPPRTYAQAASQPLLLKRFNYIAERPELIERRSMPPKTISVSANAFSTSTGAQERFDQGDRALLPLSTSGNLNEYQVLAVDENGVHFEHKLSLIDVCQPRPIVLNLI
jgi:hypothetical protein